MRYAEKETYATAVPKLWTKRRSEKTKRPVAYFALVERAVLPYT